MERLKSIDELKNLRTLLAKEVFVPGKNRIKVCCGLPCGTLGSHKVVKALEEEISRSGLQIDVVKTGCQGLCQKGPLAQIEPYGYFYQRIRPEKAGDIISTTFSAGMPAREFLHRHSFLEKPIEILGEVPFYKKQMKIALRNTGNIDPFNIHDYIGVGGYIAAEKIFSSMSPEDVMEEVKKSNLRGRGGAGFPAGIKWAHSKKSPAKIKLIIANGDEGDPGAFMDRSVMEGDPHALLEGMLICAYALNAHFGFIYVRHEYPLAIKTLETAIGQAEELGLLGRNILGTGFDFVVQIREGAGAFVCGESTALVASMEGNRGFPNPRPPRLSETGGGAWGYPSNLNNIETYACLPAIIEKGADWFLSIGTQGSPGTKVFSLAGKVQNTGLVEVPMGITLREIIYDIGGGILDNKEFKAVQTGGPSGGCIPARHLDLPVDFDSLRKVGSIMGSGGMVVMDEDNCMVDVAKFFLSFTQSESCGKCPTCRIGTYQMLQILERITSGEGEEGDIEKLEKLGQLVARGSLCGLGQSAPNPVLTTIRYFRDEYEEHVRDKYCRAKVCSGLGIFEINQDECIQCGLCKQACAFNAVIETRDKFFISRDDCTRCKSCYYVCPVNAVKLVSPKYVRLEEEFKIPLESLDMIERRSQMTLGNVIKSKPLIIMSIKNDQKISEAVEMMAENNISGVFVVDESDKLAGIFTERDIVRCATEKISLKDETLGNIMRTDLTTFEPSMALSSAIALAMRKKIRHLPVVEEDSIVGMITFRDLIKYLLPEILYMTK